MSLLLAILLLAAAPTFAHADDWLAVWPTCSIEDASRPSLSLLYPAPGLPAVVPAGESLYARVRTPSALTPPPGVQQADVLERYTAELSGSALHVGVDVKERYRYLLPVLSIRPDGVDSLVYRARVDIPAYVAPGTYAFALHTPFGTRSAQQVVRVVEPHAAPRIARLPSGLLAPPATAGTWPVDVWIAGARAEEAAREGVRVSGEDLGHADAHAHEHADARDETGDAPGHSDADVQAHADAQGHADTRDEKGDAHARDETGDADARDEKGDAHARDEKGDADAQARERTADSASLARDSSDPAPTLLAAGGSVALRVGRELWVRSGCTDDSAFEREVAGVLAVEGRSRVAFDPARTAPAPPSAATLASPLAFSFQLDRATADNSAGHTSREVSVLLPFAPRARVSSGALSFYPTAHPSARPPTTKLARWSVPASQRATLSLEPASEPRKPLVLRPTSARSGQPAHVRVLGAGAQAKVAFALGFTRTAYASRELRTSFPGPLAHPVRAQVFEADGAGEVVQGHLWVEPHRPPNCAIARPGRRRTPPEAVTAWFLVAIASLVQRRRSAKNALPKRALE